MQLRREIKAPDLAVWGWDLEPEYAITNKGLRITTSVFWPAVYGNNEAGAPYLLPIGMVR